MTNNCYCTDESFCPMHMPRSRRGEDLAPPTPLTPEMAAVIKAAKALHAKMNRGEFASTADEQAGVWQAVEALQEVEL